ncbi:hypothetical protein JYK21_08845 [Ralstonia pickettii]|nr:hypothetical protein [Ralstonia pickettii]
MTAQIATMNTGGIALASDSAVTIKGRKVYNSAEKLFGLSENHTVGVMVYGEKSMFHFPWETIIKLYGSKLNDPFDTLKEYMESFLQFLNKNEYSEFMSEVNEEKYIVDKLYTKIKQLHSKLSRINKRLSSEYGELRPQNEIQEMYDQQAKAFIDKRMNHLKGKSYPKGFNHKDYELLLEKYAKRIVELICNKFESHLYLIEWLEDINYILIQALIKEFSGNFSGIILSGFGNKELYPSLYILIIDGKINNKTKYFVEKRSIDDATHGMILPFAQRDMIKGFLDGINGEMEKLLLTDLKNEFNLLSDTLIHNLNDNFRKEMDLEAIKNEISDALMQVYDRQRENILRYKRENFTYPILDVVESLPVKELADMAEALLNVAALKRKFSTSVESVGGPIDVAVITKAEGFTWVNKK